MSRQLKIHIALNISVLGTHLWCRWNFDQSSSKASKKSRLLSLFFIEIIIIQIFTMLNWLLQIVGVLCLYLPVRFVFFSSYKRWDSPDLCKELLRGEILDISDIASIDEKIYLPEQTIDSFPFGRCC